MTLAVDSQMASNVGFGVAGSPPTSPQTFSFTNTAGNLLYVWVGVGVAGASTAPDATVTYGGVSMTSVVSATTSGSTTGGKLQCYRLTSPATSSNTVSIAFATSGVLEVWAGAISFSGYVSGTPEVQTNTAQGVGTTGTVTLSGVAAGNFTIGCGGAGSAIAGGTTIDWLKNVDGSSSLGNGRASVLSSTGSVSETITGFASDSWTMAIVEVAAGAATPLGFFTPHRMPLGV